MVPYGKCEWPECKKPVTQWLGYTGFDGSGVRFIRTKAFCDEHMKQYQQEKDPNAGVVERIQ